MSKLTTLKPRITMLGSGVKAIRTSPVERTRGRKWMETRKRILSANPLCPMCEAKGDVSAATEVDHRKPLDKGGSDDDTNLQGLCHDCHAAKTTEEQRKRFGG